MKNNEFARNNATSHQLPTETEEWKDPMSGFLRGYPDVLRPEDVQEILQTGRNTTYKLLKSGAIRSILIAGKYRIPKRYLLDFLYANEETYEKEER